MFMAHETASTGKEGIQSLILTIRRQRVMLDSDLARIYDVTTKQLNQALGRNPERFPIDFAFQIDLQEFAHLRSQFVTSNVGRGGRRHLPWVFTEHGALMLASILKSPVAVEASVRVVRAFVAMRETLAAHKELARKLEELEAHVGHHDQAIQNLFEAIRQMTETPVPEDRRQIGFRETPPPYRVKVRG